MRPGNGISFLVVGGKRQIFHLAMDAAAIPHQGRFNGNWVALLRKPEAFEHTKTASQVSTAHHLPSAAPRGGHAPV
jgi:hypothetical protein